MTKSISPDQLLRQSDRFVRIIDVRKPEDFAQDPNIIPGAERRLPQEVDSWKQSLSPKKNIIVYCVHGHQVSQGACRALSDFGLDACYLEGGVEGWKQAGGQTKAF